MSDNKYFANLNIDEITNELDEKIEQNKQYIMGEGFLSLWKNSMFTYTKSGDKAGEVTSGGQHNEYTMIGVNHYRNLISHILSLVANQRPSFEPVATNTDYKSQAQTVLADSLLEYYIREKKLERYIKQATQYALLFGEGYVKVEWDSEEGEILDYHEETGTPIRQGDIRYETFAPYDVFRDINQTDNSKHNWYILRSYQNKYDLAEKHPEIRDEILDISDDKDWAYELRVDKQYDNDYLIPVYEFFHKSTASVPNGRRTVFVDDIVLEDGPLPYRDLPVYRIVQEEYIERPYGYSVAFDLIPMQQSIDNLYSTILTNQTTFGTQNIMLPKGHNLSVSQLSGGLNVLEYDSKLGKPESLNLTDTPAEIFNFIQMLEQMTETISGVNSVARGNPESSLQSGSALALVQAQAISFNAALQQAYIQLLEDVGTATINTLRDYATTPRVVAIVGKSKRYMMKEFTGDDLDLVNRVTVDVGNPLTNTVAGRVQLAENLIANQMIDNVDSYLQVLTTGKLDPVIEGQNAELLNIKSENEELMIGNWVDVIVTDSHREHILEHKSLLASPEARRNPEVIQTVTAHIQEHIQELSNPENANLLQLLGQAPMQEVNAQPMGNMSAQAPSMAEPSNEVMEVQGLDGQATDVNMPNMPQVDPALAPGANPNQL